MKKYIIAFLITLIVAIGVVFAFGGKHGNRFFGRNREVFMERMFERVSTKLNMSDEQKAQAKTILADAKTRVEPLMEKMKQNNETSKNFGTDGVFDEQTAQTLANEQAEITKQLFIEKKKTKAQLFALLNNDQREQAKKMMEEFGNRFNRGGRKEFGSKSETGF